MSVDESKNARGEGRKRLGREIMHRRRCAYKINSTWVEKKTGEQAGARRFFRRRYVRAVPRGSGEKGKKKKLLSHGVGRRRYGASFDETSGSFLTSTFLLLRSSSTRFVYLLSHRIDLFHVFRFNQSDIFLARCRSHRALARLLIF